MQTNKTFATLLGVLLAITFLPAPGGAQEKENVLTHLRNLQERLEEENDAALPKTLAIINKSQETNRFIKSGLDQETAERLNNLKNPFIADLPKDDQEDVIIEAPTETPTIEAAIIETPKPVPPRIQISGLIWNTDRPQAILNGKIVDIGERVESWIITSISREGVTLNFQEETLLIEP